MITDDIKALYNQGKWALVIRGLFGIALGVFIIARPIESVAVLALVVAIWAVVDGIVNIVHAFHLRGVVSHWWTILVSGILGVLFGVAAFYFYPGLSLAFVVLGTAFWLIMGGVAGIYIAMQQRNAQLSWGWALVFGILSLGAGVVTSLNPEMTLAGLISLIAAFGIVGGITLLIGAGKMQTFEGELYRVINGPARP